MLLLVLAAGLGLLSAHQAFEPLQLILAYPSQLLGKWHIKRWIGNLPIPEDGMRHPLPPLTFWINYNSDLELKMHILKPSGCQLFKMPFDGPAPTGYYETCKVEHNIHIWLITMTDHLIAYFKDQMNLKYVRVAGLLGRTLDENPKALKVFEDFVESKGLNKTLVIDPPQVEACKLDGSS